jgi:hypothetical protein
MMFGQRGNAALPEKSFLTRISLMVANSNVKALVNQAGAEAHCPVWLCHSHTPILRKHFLTTRKVQK